MRAGIRAASKLFSFLTMSFALCDLEAHSRKKRQGAVFSFQRIFQEERVPARHPREYAKTEEKNMIRQTGLFRKVAGFLLAIAAFALVALNASAQSADKFTLSEDAAKKALTKDEISGETAAKIAQVCQDFAAKHNFSAIIFILDPSGNIVHAHRMDGARPIQFDSALNKARTALFMRASTHQLENRFANNIPQQVKFAQRNLDPTSGGLPIIVNNQLIGAIGVAGSDPNDEDCANAGLTEVLGPQPPLAPKRPTAAPAQGQPAQ